MIYLFSLLISLLISFLFLFLCIPYLKEKQLKQTERDEGLQSHKAKNGTLTMGGIFFIVSSMFASMFASLLSYNTITSEWLIITIIFIGYGMIGFIDDLLIVKYHNNKGLSPRIKFMLQSLLAIIFCILLKVLLPYHTTIIQIFAWEIDLSWIYYVLIFFMFTATSNGINLSDGLDGLSSGLAIFAFIAYGIISISIRNLIITSYISAIIGGLLGFLYFNKHPAKIFMGDVGSLSLGGLLASIAILTKQELLLIIIGGVFVIETLSVIIQVSIYKATKKRIFKMAPIHHHFEICGWSETKVVSVFWLCGAIFCAIGVSLYLIFR